MLGIKADERSRTSDHEWIGPAPWMETPFPGPNARDFAARDLRLCTSPPARDLPLVARRGLGSVIEDVDGNRLLDLAAGFAVGVTGYSHPKVAAAIEAQARTLVHICGTAFLHAPMVELRERLEALVPGSAGKRVFLTNGPQGAIGVAVELARHHTGKKNVLAFHDPDHIGVLGVFGRDIRSIPYGDIKALESGGRNGASSADTIGAILVEAVQPETGQLGIETRFLLDLRALCDKHGMVLICDEIRSGLGRTGRMFAFEHFGVEPDIILVGNSLAGGLPLGAVISRAEIGTSASTAMAHVCGGNPVCCAAALATLDLLNANYLANAQKLGCQLIERLHRLADRNKSVFNVQGLGLMCVVEIVNRRSGKSDPKACRQILQGCLERGVILHSAGHAGILFSPALCINEAQLDVGLRVFESSVTAVT